MAFILWLTGLPGAGKSEIARVLVGLLDEEGEEIEYLRMNKIKTELGLTSYDDSSREKAYHELINRALQIYDEGSNVLIDATGYKRKWRDDIRAIAPGFIEVYVKSSLQKCVAAEMKKKNKLGTKEVYTKALNRRMTGEKYPELGTVVGVDVAYEAPRKPSLILDRESMSVAQAGKSLFEFLRKNNFI
ncbi:MAG: adenylyl-sulfate kinase [Candidatus Woesearchaeota archaeon]